MNQPTNRQREALAFIDRFVAARAYAPSVREIGLALGLRSTSTVAQHLRSLEDKGFLTRNRHGPRTLALTAAGRALVAELTESAAADRIKGGGRGGDKPKVHQEDFERPEAWPEESDG